MTTAQALATLSALGIRRSFRPVIESETEAVLLKTRRPAQIVGGELEGCEISQRGSAFVVWTGQAVKAKKLAKRYGLKIRGLCGEAEVTVPATLADEVLPKFGAQVRRELTPEQKAALRARFEQARNSPNSRIGPAQERSLGPLTPDVRGNGQAA